MSNHPFSSPTWMNAASFSLIFAKPSDWILYPKRLSSIQNKLIHSRAQATRILDLHLSERQRGVLIQGGIPANVTSSLDQPVGVRETVNKHYFSRDEGRALMAYQRLLDERRGMHFLVSVLQGDRRPAEVETFALQRFFWVKKVLSVVPTCLLNLGNGLLTDIS
ncbi:hypothetical protein PGT21_015612 [Puccinia graminis f. sp. tritici]|uniref:Uncharacterized protein n=1 Tax=Puccinia graminis f. sp. tritici TaxID=56615 RepID=A0A5B0NCE9_PUCGR|nr:hypothetical protein PGT21_015612 [Puccinia graminis f. sp. tritici]